MKCFRILIKATSVLGVLLWLGGCSAAEQSGDDDAPAGSGGTPATGSGGAAPSGSGGKASSGSGGALSSNAGTPASGSGGSKPPAGSGGVSGAGIDAGHPDASTAARDLVECESASTDACGGFTTVTGVHLTMGPYGAVMEKNVGAGFENAVASGDSDGGASCSVFAATFGEDADETAMLLDTKDLNFALYTVYRPANMIEGETYPVVTWGNGTCAQPEGYGALLRYVASYGYFVVSSNSRWVGGATEMLHALDFAAAANEDAASPYYHRLDLTKVAAAGHSQGGMGTVNAATDARVQTAIIFNGGSSADKPFLAISGDMDITGYTPQSMASAVNGAAPKGAWLYYHMIPVTGNISGHLTLMLQPDRVTDATVGWLDMVFRSEPAATALFVGASCGLCGKDADFEYGQKGL